MISAIMLSDHTVREEGTNKLSLIGCFAQWYAPSFPFSVPPFCVTPFVGNFRASSGQLEITARLETGSRHVLWSASAKINFESLHGTMPADLLIDIPFKAIGVTFPMAGQYVIRIFVDADEIASRPVTVLAMTGGFKLPEKK